MAAGSISSQSEMNEEHRLHKKPKIELHDSDDSGDVMIVDSSTEGKTTKLSFNDQKPMSSEIMSQALSIVFQHLMVLDLGWKLDIFVNRLPSLKQELLSARLNVIPTSQRAEKNKITRELSPIINNNQHIPHELYDNNGVTLVGYIENLRVTDVLPSNPIAIDEYRDESGKDEVATDENPDDMTEEEVDNLRYYKYTDLVNAHRVLCQLAWFPFSLWMEYEAILYLMEMRESYIQLYHKIGQWFKLHSETVYRRRNSMDRQSSSNLDISISIYHICTLLKWQQRMEIVEMAMFTLAMVPLLLRQERHKYEPGERLTVFHRDTEKYFDQESIFELCSAFKYHEFFERCKEVHIQVINVYSIYLYPCRSQEVEGDEDEQEVALHFATLVKYTKALKIQVQNRCKLLKNDSNDLDEKHGAMTDFTTAHDIIQHKIPNCLNALWCIRFNLRQLILTASKRETGEFDRACGEPVTYWRKYKNDQSLHWLRWKTAIYRDMRVFSLEMLTELFSGQITCPCNWLFVPYDDFPIGKKLVFDHIVSVMEEAYSMLCIQSDYFQAKENGEEFDETDLGLDVVGIPFMVKEITNDIDKYSLRSLPYRGFVGAHQRYRRFNNEEHNRRPALSKDGSFVEGMRLLQGVYYEEWFSIINYYLVCNSIWWGPPCYAMKWKGFESPWLRRLIDEPFLSEEWRLVCTQTIDYTEKHHHTLYFEHQIASNKGQIEVVITKIVDFSGHAQSILGRYLPNSSNVSSTDGWESTVALYGREFVLNEVDITNSGGSQVLNDRITWLSQKITHKNYKRIENRDAHEIVQTIRNQEIEEVKKELLPWYTQFKTRFEEEKYACISQSINHLEGALYDVTSNEPCAIEETDAIVNERMIDLAIAKLFRRLIRFFQQDLVIPMPCNETILNHKETNGLMMSGRIQTITVLRNAIERLDEPEILTRLRQWHDDNDYETSNMTCFIKRLNRIELLTKAVIWLSVDTNGMYECMQSMQEFRLLPRNSKETEYEAMSFYISTLQNCEQNMMESYVSNQENTMELNDGSELIADIWMVIRSAVHGIYRLQSLITRMCTLDTICVIDLQDRQPSSLGELTNYQLLDVCLTWIEMSIEVCIMRLDMLDYFVESCPMMKEYYYSESNQPNKAMEGEIKVDLHDAASRFANDDFEEEDMGSNAYQPRILSSAYFDSFFEQRSACSTKANKQSSSSMLMKDKLMLNVSEAESVMESFLDKLTSLVDEVENVKPGDIDALCIIAEKFIQLLNEPAEHQKDIQLCYQRLHNDINEVRQWLYNSAERCKQGLIEVLKNVL